MTDSPTAAPISPAPAGTGVMPVLIVTGMSGAALTMSRYWTPAIAAKSLGLVLNLALSLTLIPQLGATGAAIGFATGIVVANSVMAWRAWTLLHLDTTALALVFRRAG